MIWQTRTFTNYSIRSVEDDGTFSAVANDFTEVDDYGTRFTAGSVKESLEWWRQSEEQGRDRLRIVLHHDEKQIVGYPEVISVDENALVIERGRLLIDDLEDARKSHVYMRTRLMTGFSLAFYEQASHKDGNDIVFDKVKIRHIGHVLWPSNQGSRLQAVREAINSGRYPTEREFEEHLQMIGLSKSDARAFVRNGYHKAWTSEGLISTDDPSEELRAASGSLREFLRTLREHKQRRLDHDRGAEKGH